MANLKNQTLQNQFKLHDIKFTNSSNYLAFQLDLNGTPMQLNEILAALKTVASKLENLADSSHDSWLLRAILAEITWRINPCPSLRRQNKISTNTKKQCFPQKPSSRLSYGISPPLWRRNDILDVTAAKPWCYLQQYTDRSNLCACVPPFESSNIQMTDTTQVSRIQPEEFKFDEDQGTFILPPTEQQTILPANLTQSPQLYTTANPYYNRGHIAYNNNFFSVCHQLYRASNADNAEPFSSSRPGCPSTLPTRAIKHYLITTYHFSAIRPTVSNSPQRSGMCFPSNTDCSSLSQLRQPPNCSVSIYPGYCFACFSCTTEPKHIYYRSTSITVWNAKITLALPSTSAVCE